MNSRYVNRAHGLWRFVPCFDMLLCLFYHGKQLSSTGSFAHGVDSGELGSYVLGNIPAP